MTELMDYKTATDKKATPEEVAQSTASDADLCFETKKFVLQALLEKAAAVLPTRDVMAVLKNFQLEVTEEGRLTVVATDLELSVLATTELVSVTRPGVAVFPGKKLLEIVKEAGDGDLVLDVHSGTASIRVGRTAWDLKLMDGSEYPELPDIANIDFHATDRTKFLAAINAVKYAAATDTVRPNLMLIDFAEGKVRASDGLRLQQVDLTGFPVDIQIPILAVDDVLKLLKMTEVVSIEVGVDDNFIAFRVAGDVFVANKLNATFPDVDQQILLPSLANDQHLQVDRSELISAIKRVRINADPETSAVVLSMSNDQLLVKAKDKYGNTASEPLDVKWSSGDREVCFNHVHLVEMLQMADVKTCSFKFGADTKTRKSPILFQDEGSGLIGVLNQLRLDFVS